MKKNQNITIVLLLITASLLTAMLVVTFNATSEPAYASGSVKQGDYIMTTGHWSRTTDLVYIIDIATRRMNAYFLDRNKKTIDLVDSTDLEKAFSR